MEPHTNPIQDIVRRIVNENLRGSTQRFEWIIMSVDASGHNAELYGSGGKIYYRKEGGAGVELGGGGVALWESCTIDNVASVRTSPYAAIECQNHDLFNVDDIYIRRGGSGEASDSLTFRCEIGGGGSGHPDWGE